MKKLAIGCSVVVLVLAVAGIAATYWVYRKVSTTVSQLAAFGEVPALERQVRNTTPYVPPASGELTAEQVERLVQVQGAVRQRLGQRFAELRRRHEALLTRDQPGALDVPDLVAAYRDLGQAWLDAKRAQVEALNAARFSLEEYRWVREQAYAALGVPVMTVDVSKLIESVTGGDTSALPARIGGSVGPAGSERNRALVARFTEALEQNVALATFGL